MERRLLPDFPGGPHLSAKQLAGAVELIGVGALKREDGLLAIADGEDGARRSGGGFPYPGADEELGGQSLSDAPLFRRGVLDLVEQEMVEATIELVEHPGGARVHEQRSGAADQVVVVGPG